MKLKLNGKKENEEYEGRKDCVYEFPYLKGDF